MYTELADYQKPSDFATEYPKKDGSKGVNRAYIYKLINMEIESPESTKIDVLDVGGVRFVKFKTKS